MVPTACNWEAVFYNEETTKIETSPVAFFALQEGTTGLGDRFVAIGSKAGEPMTVLDDLNNFVMCLPAASLGGSSKHDLEAVAREALGLDDKLKPQRRPRRKKSTKGKE
jgi:hypothetical protein